MISFAIGKLGRRVTAADQGVSGLTGAGWRGYILDGITADSALEFMPLDHTMSLM